MSGSFAAFWLDFLRRVQGGIQTGAPRAVLVLFIFGFFYLVAQLFKLYGYRSVDVNLYRKPTQEAINQYNKARRKVFIGRFFWLFFLTLAWVGAISASGVAIRTVLEGLGFLGVSLSFALSDLIQQYIAGFLILNQKHVNIGEQIEVHGTAGVVKSIEARYTIVRDFKENDVMVPNTDILRNAVLISSVEGLQRDVIRVRVDNDTDLRVAIKVGEEAIKNTRGVDSSVPPRGYLRYFGDSMQLAFYYTGAAARREHFIVRSEALLNLTDAFKRNNIKIAYPTGLQYIETEAD
ncbi:MAG: mechanosensitive ion channel [Candidatus Andersenbacteria bacterium]